jgi:hypothetical protein
LKSETEWRAYTKSNKKPDDIPASPSRTYAEVGWAGMGDWLGTGRVAHRKLRDWLGAGRLRRSTARPFKKARVFVRGLGLKSVAEWRTY